jgi:hypothetical protein
MAKFPKSKQPPKILRSVDHVLTFGKYKGLTVGEVMKKDVNWIHWALQNIPDFKLNRNALLLLPPIEDRNAYDDRDWGTWHDMR